MIPKVRVEEVNPAEAQALLSRLKNKSGGHVGLDLSFKGHINAVCKEETGEEAWSVDQENLVTDRFRRAFPWSLVSSVNIFTSPSIDTPSAQRYTLCDNGSNNSSQSSSVAISRSPGTLSCSWAVVFSTPSAPRTIGTIGIGIHDNYVGVYNVWAYSLLTPSKVQGTTQTLEITYRLTLTIAV
jgi:hypothetical protein